MREWCRKTTQSIEFGTTLREMTTHLSPPSSLPWIRTPGLQGCRETLFEMLFTKEDELDGIDPLEMKTFRAKNKLKFRTKIKLYVRWERFELLNYARDQFPNELNQWKLYIPGVSISNCTNSTLLCNCISGIALFI
jgi:hypothetical protein